MGMRMGYNGMARPRCIDTFDTVVSSISLDCVLCHYSKPRRPFHAERILRLIKTEKK
jgi:hypothetical protein